MPDNDMAGRETGSADVISIVDRTITRTSVVGSGVREKGEVSKMMYTRDWETEPAAGERDYAEPSSSEILAFEQHAGESDRGLRPWNALFCMVLMIAFLLVFVPLVASAIIIGGFRAMYLALGKTGLSRISKGNKQ